MKSESTKLETQEQNSKSWTFVCNERKGDVERVVRPLNWTIEDIRTFWEKAKPHKVLFWQEIDNDFQKFIECFFYQDSDGSLQANGLFYVVDDFVGLLYITDIRPMVDAQCHFVFFDGGLRGRKPLVAGMLKVIFETYKFHRLSVEIPVYSRKALFNFTESLGFQFEGKRREAVFFDKGYFDVIQYYLLKRDFLKVE